MLLRLIRAIAVAGIRINDNCQVIWPEKVLLMENVLVVQVCESQWRLPSQMGDKKYGFLQTIA